MKRFATIASAALLAMSGLFGTACSTKANAVENESSSVKKTFNVTGFTEVDAGHQFEVDIKPVVASPWRCMLPTTPSNT